MRIDHLTVKNFKGFKDRELHFHQQFNLIVGENGAGKTSVLDALAVAAGAWLLGIKGYDSRHIRANEVHLQGRFFRSGKAASQEQGSFHLESQYPCEVLALGGVNGNVLEWKRTLNGPDGRTTSVGAREIKKLAEAADLGVREGREVLLPLISYYGTGRLWDEPREVKPGGGKLRQLRREEMSRLFGYKNSVDPRTSLTDLEKWIQNQSLIAFQEGLRRTPQFEIVHDALTGLVERAKSILFDAKRVEVMVAFDTVQMIPVSKLSDGQRTMLAMVGDIARKAAILNPHLGKKALKETPGIVLIDELDLHLHPNWQRHVIEDLRRTFPRIQFFATTHSPFLIQSLRSGEELLILDDKVPTQQLSNKSIEDIARGIMGVPETGYGVSYQGAKEAARDYLELLDEAAAAPRKKLAEYERRLSEGIAPYADNPAYQAFLEMKRAAKLGQ